jgi:hypothetical protein
MKTVVISAKKERPILFSTPMMQANLAGTKTQTRRLIKPQPPAGAKYLGSTKAGLNSGKVGFFWELEPETPVVKFWPDKEDLFCHFGQVSDLLWVRETWRKSDFTLNGFTYKAAAHPQISQKGWKTSIHMPREACRMVLEITSVRPERLNEISEADAIAEGVLFDNISIRFFDYVADSWEDYYQEDSVKIGQSVPFPHPNPAFSARDSYKTLIQSLYPKPKPVKDKSTKQISHYEALAWDADDAKRFPETYRGKEVKVLVNPWMWVIEYKIVEGIR